jgi:hypothetical protein
MSKRIRAYLSGGMEYAKNEGASWRKGMEHWIANELGHSVFNPNVESEKYMKKKLKRGNLRKLKFTNVDKFQSIVRGIVKLDSAEIASRSDYVVCLWNGSAQRGAGTKGELSIARYFDKPVYMVTRMRRDRIPGWILGCTSDIFSSFDELKKFLLTKYMPKRNAPPSRSNV